MIMTDIREIRQAWGVEPCRTRDEYQNFPTLHYTSYYRYT